MLRLVQLQHPHHGRRVAIVDEPQLRLIARHTSAYALAEAAIAAQRRIADVIEETPERIAYDDVDDGKSDWKLLPACDHPAEPARCLVSGTGLTHNASAASRDAMHAGGAAHTPEHPTDSMKMYRSGVQGGRPARGQIGAMPE